MIPFANGFRKMFPILTGVIPFGAVMGSVSAEAGLTFSQSTLMNLLCYAGASQLAAVDLMTKPAPVFVVVITGLMINLRFLLYSASMASHLQSQSPWRKFVSAYFLTDQAYGLMLMHEDKLKTSYDHVQFYLGASCAMFLAWNSSVAGGYLFGNFAPKEWSLDFAVPLSFVVLLVPTLKNKTYAAVAAFSAVASVAFYFLPMRLGLIAAVTCAMIFAWWLTRRRPA